MSFARTTKLSILEVCRVTGISNAVLDSEWRRRRLLIVAWHGLAIDDEHLWNPHLYLSVDAFRSRLQLLRASNCNVLPLGLAVQQLMAGTLPPRAVALTIDDGDSSVFLHSWSMLREFGYPATLYWSTYYSTRPFAVFDPMLSYLLWKGRGRHTRVPGPLARDCDLATEDSRRTVFRSIYSDAKENAWTAEQKELFLTELAANLGVDFSSLKARRILHMITPGEAEAMRLEGLDLQLHTHRHRVPLDESKFGLELRDNARVIQSTGAPAPVHFCYPSGSFDRRFPDWLQRHQVISGTTTQPGLATRESDIHLLPRHVDAEIKSALEFSAWICGVASWIVRAPPMSTHSFE